MIEIQSTQTKKSSAALKTTEEILDELIRGTVPEVMYSDAKLHSFPNNVSVPQSERIGRHSYNPDKYCMYQRPVGYSKVSGLPRLEVKKWEQGQIPGLFPNVNELSAKTVTDQHQGKEICTPVDTEPIFKQPCRVCRQEKDVKGMNSIFSDNKQYENLPFILKTLVDLEVTPDTEQPARICALCFETLTVFFCFYQKVKIAQYIFKGSLKSEKSLAGVSNNADKNEVTPVGAEHSQLVDRASPVSYHSDQEDSLNTPISVKLASIKLPPRLRSEETKSRVSPRIKKAKHILANSSFSHLVNRKISDEKWEHIYSIMTSSDEENGSRLKVLDDCILYHPFAGDWHCIDCKKTISGGRTKFIDHSLESHVWYPEHVMFPCDVCGLVFPVIDSSGINENYCEHWLNHFFPKECSVCQMKFVTHCALREHKESVHGEGLIECNQCEQVFAANSELKLHKSKDHATPEGKQKRRDIAWCQLCNKNVVGLWQHNAKCHFEETAWKCEDCDKKFLTRSHLKSHHSRVHPDIKRPRSFKCHICSESFRSPGLKTSHVHAVHRIREKMCSICDKRFLLPHQLKTHMLTHQATGNCVCEVCGKSVKGKSHLKEHMNIHNDEKPFECPICGVKIRMKSNLWKHMKTAHKTTMKAYRESTGNNSSTIMETEDINIDVVSTTEENQSLRCKDCGEFFQTIHILQVHRDSVHLGRSKNEVQEEWKCDYCDDSFNSATAKGKHIEEKHEDKIEISTTCLLCNKKYSNIMAYKSHMRRLHTNSVKEPVEVSCEICGKVLKSKKILEGHIKHIHLPTTNSVPCPLCPWKFRSEDRVKSHMRNTHKVSMAEYRKSLVSTNTTSQLLKRND